jgi:hypothetical protein
MIAYYSPVSFLGILAVFGTTKIYGQEKLSQHDEAIVRATLGQYIVHRQSFPYFKCRIVVKNGTCSTLDDALSGRFKRLPTMSERRLAQDGGKAACESHVDPAILEKAIEQANKTGANPVGVPESPRSELYNRGFKVNYLPDFKGMAGVFSPDFPHKPIGITPFSLEYMSQNDIDYIEKHLSAYDAGNSYCKLFPEAQWNQLNLRPIGFGAVGSPLAVKFFFDSAHGYLIRKLEIYNEMTGDPLTETYVTDLSECSRHRWFPTRWVKVISKQQMDTSPFVTREVTVTEFDVENRPTRDDLSIEVKAGTQISYQLDGTSFKTRQRERIHVDQIPTLIEMCHKKEQNPVMDTAINPPPVPKPPRWPWYLGGAVAVTALLALVWWRRKASHPPAPGSTPA